MKSDTNFILVSDFFKKESSFMKRKFISLVTVLVILFATFIPVSADFENVDEIKNGVLKISVIIDEEINTNNLIVGTFCTTKDGKMSFLDKTKTVVLGSREQYFEWDLSLLSAKSSTIDEIGLLMGMFASSEPLEFYVKEASIEIDGIKYMLPNLIGKQICNTLKVEDEYARIMASELGDQLKSAVEKAGMSEDTILFLFGQRHIIYLSDKSIDNKLIAKESNQYYLDLCDIDENGLTSMLDLVKLKKQILGIESRYTVKSDLNKDGKVDTSDLLIVVDYLANS